MEGLLGLSSQLAALLVAGDPRGAAERRLEFLRSLNNARAAVVFALEADRLILFTGRGFSLEAMATVQAAWADHQTELVAGQTLRASDPRATYAIAPLIENGSVVALLYLDVAAGDPWAALDMGSLSAFRVPSAQARNQT